MAAAAHSRGTALAVSGPDTVCLSVYVLCITVGRGGGDGGDQSVVQLRKKSSREKV